MEAEKTIAHPYYVTTAIPYVNAPPHVGFAFETLLADVLARYHRLCGRPVRFQSGTWGGTAWRDPVPGGGILFAKTP